MKVFPFLLVETAVTTPSTATFFPTYIQASQTATIVSALDGDGSHAVNRKAKTKRRRGEVMAVP
jgi:hypothetical protein